MYFTKKLLDLFVFFWPFELPSVIITEIWYCVTQISKLLARIPGLEMTTEPLGSWNLFVFLVESTNIWVMRKSRLLSILVLAMLGCGNIENAMARKLLFESALVPVTSPSPAAPYSNDGTHEGSSLRRVVIISIVVAIPAFVVLIMVSSICCWYNKKSPEENVNQKKDPATPDKYIVIPIVPFLNNINSRFSKKKGWASQIEYSVLQEATDNFSCDNILGEGGFGCVYKAKFDENSVAAVKKIDASSKTAELEFQNEVELMSRIRHTNLVSLLGFCSCGNANFLVYELMQNGSLEDQLHGPSHGSALTWHLRMKIALDAARGLEHLHEQCNPSVIHRDFKSSNILLDSSFNAKLSDFGLAVKASRVNGNADAELLGTLGYVAPEYMLDGKLTEKSDVYAYGVVLLELLFGRKPVDKTLLSECQSLVSWAMPQLTDRAKLPNIIDPVIKDTMNMKHLYQVAAIAVLCIQPEPSYRPLIADVVHSLVPLVPVDLGGALRVSNAGSSTT